MTSDTLQIPGYELLRRLGAGGMSTVYLALQRSLDRKVAIKVMRRTANSASADAKQFERRFLLEGRMMAKLPHRNIVAVFDIVSNETIAYIAMEYLEGGMLSDRMKSGLSLAEAISVIVQIAGALEFAHKHGVVHRDLKPANIMFRDAGTPVLTDFGIARYQDASATKLTQTGMLVGTPTYMSPEQINATEVDGRADLYSLGILFYELLTGLPPFQGESPIAVLMAHLTQPPPPLPAEFAAFQGVLDRMLAKNREERYPDMVEFSSDLKSRLVQSSTLLTRLHIDPTQTSSEQLRALGFSTSTPTGDGLSAVLLDRLPTPSGPRPAVRPISQRFPAAEPAPPAVAARRVPLAWLIAGLGALLIAIGVALMLRGHGGLSKDEQELVSLWLKQANSYVAADKLLAPPDENAYAYVQKVLQKDPDNGQAQALLDAIAVALSKQAQAALAAGKLDEAAEWVNQGLLVHTDDAALGAIKARIEQAQKAAQARAQLQGLLTRADSARSSGQMFGEGSAYALLLQARALAPDDPTIEQRIVALLDQQLAAPRSALQSGDLTSAADVLARLQPFLESEPAYSVLKAQVDAALKKQQLERQFVALQTRGSEQLRNGRLVEPGGDNAYETFGEMRKAAPDDKRAGEFAGNLSRALLADARRLDSAGQPDRALERAGLALQISPQLADAQALKTKIEQRLGQRAAQLAQALTAAQQAIAEQRFLPPAPNDARAALDAVLKLDQNNAQAKQLLVELPSRIAASASARAAENDATGAVELVAAARRAFPEDQLLMQLAQKLDVQLKSDQAATQAQLMRERIGKVLLAAAPTVEQLRATGRELAGLQAADPDGKDTQALRKRYLDTLGTEMQDAAGGVEFDALAALLKELQGVLETDPGFAALTQTLPALRKTVVDAEQERLAAQRGELVLNAYPWGKVESVLDANRQPIALPADATTPLTLTLPAGSYVITFRHPQAAKPAQVIAKVEARKRGVANAAFPTISAQEYFSRAGW